MQRIRGKWQRLRHRLSVRDSVLAMISTSLARATANRCRLFCYCIVAQPVPNKPLPAPKLGSSLTVRQLFEGDPALSAFPRPQAVFKARFQQGAVCYAAFRGDEPAGYIWFTLGPYEEDEVRCVFHTHPKDNTAWDFDVYVAPPFRFTSAFIRLWNTACAHMREHDVQWTMSRISAFNANSIASHRRLGAQDLGRLTFLTLGTLQFMWGAAPLRMHLSMRPASRPRVELDAGHLDIDSI